MLKSILIRQSAAKPEMERSTTILLGVENYLINNFRKGGILFVLLVLVEYICYK